MRKPKATETQTFLPHATHARSRESVDNPSLAFLGTFGSLTAPDYEAEWRSNCYDDRTLDRISTPELLLRLVDLSPEISKGLWDFLRFSNAGYELKAYRVGGTETTEEPRAQVVLDTFLARLKAIYGSESVVFNRLFISAFLRGSFFAELVLDQNGREAVDIATPDPRWIQFEPRTDPVRGAVYVPYQQQQGRRVYMDRETIRYVPVDPVPGSPFGRALAAPAVFTCLFSMGLLRDLRRVVAQQGYPRIDIKVVGENLKSWLSADVLADATKLKAAIADIMQQVKTSYQNLRPDDAWIHTNATEIGRPVGTVDSTSLGAIDALVRFLERNLTCALKSAPFLLGLSESNTETQATRQVEAYLGSIQAVQHLAEGLLEHLFTLAVQAAGLQADVEFRFQEVRAAEMLRDEQVRQLQTTVAIQQYLAGFLSLDEACGYATGKEKADVPEPRALPSGFTAAGGAAIPATTQDTGTAANRSAPMLLSPIDIEMLRLAETMEGDELREALEDLRTRVNARTAADRSIEALLGDAVPVAVNRNGKHAEEP